MEATTAPNAIKPMIGILMFPPPLSERSLKPAVLFRPAPGPKKISGAEGLCHRKLAWRRDVPAVAPGLASLIRATKPWNHRQGTAVQPSFLAAGTIYMQLNEERGRARKLPCSWSVNSRSIRSPGAAVWLRVLGIAVLVLAVPLDAYGKAC